MTLNFMHLTFFHHCGGTQDYTLHFELDHNCMIKTHIYLFSVDLTQIKVKQMLHHSRTFCWHSRIFNYLSQFIEFNISSPKYYFFNMSKYTG